MAATDLNKTGGGIITEINVTPMVDIMLVLLIIFMVTATYIARRAIPVNLPEAATGQDVEASTLSIVLSPGGGLLLNGDTVTLDMLRERVPPVVAANPDVQAVVDGDRTVEYGRVMEVIDTLRSAGVKNFAAAVEHSPKPM
ncbi:MAG: biopolymer transporter ExbD [Deltaproteobacteria bacterium]|nr:biopolymer transporter ExbD [Deltaproteobacteria bacterium]